MRSLGLLVLCIIAISPNHAAEVVSVHDGDTITVMDGRARISVRFACSDAPEITQKPDGQESKQYLQSMLPLGSNVRLSIKETDRFDRTVAEVFKGNININQSMVATGNAFSHWRYSRGCNMKEYSKLENTARIWRIGVWATPGGIVRPWNYKRPIKNKYDD